MPTIDQRAMNLFGGESGAIAWPYGLETPRPKYLATLSPADADAAVMRAADGQKSIVEWAERYGLRPAVAGCCPHWLGRKVSRSCAPGRCTRYGGSVPDAHWLDHTLAWVKDRRPAALTGAPYRVDADDEQRIAWWLDHHTNLRFTRGRGWYGLSTEQLVMWHADRVGPLTAA